MAYVTESFKEALKVVLTPVIVEGVLDEDFFDEEGNLVSLDEFSLPEIQEFMVSEDYGQLDELSKALLGRYINSANFDGGMQDFRHGMIAAKVKGPRTNATTRPERARLAGKSQQRANGIASAVKRLTREATESDLEDMLQESKLASSRIQDKLDALRAAKDKKADAYDFGFGDEVAKPKTKVRNVGAYGKTAQSVDDDEGENNDSKVKNAAPAKRGRGRPRKNV